MPWFGSGLQFSYRQKLLHYFLKSTQSANHTVNFSRTSYRTAVGDDNQKTAHKKAHCNALYPFENAVKNSPIISQPMQQI